ncbi:glycosyltransferase family 4 protein [Caldicoprobacter algeriensis]|uniref:glycosyltransferase family 4 protein n=1 Tax=Caldicoprobacter algeriensis TaxID=699281 RepID=UPI0020792638|nr:glycosyltransferase family 1 protein [Caldicoprobacter algeriensis]MCM8901690.1 glycosyltransferase family 4 protein [Caldicoprobacter algeriensis]
MKIAIDARMISSSGIGTYIRNLLPNIIDIANEHGFVIIGENIKDVNNLVNRKNVDFIQLNARIFSIKEQLKLPSLVPKCDIFWSPNVNIPLLPLKAKYRIATIHDVVHVAHPEFFKPEVVMSFKFFLREALRKSDVILTVSNFSKSEIIKYGKIMGERIHVVYPACNTKIYNSENVSYEDMLSVRRKYNLPDRFLLYVGNIKPHKNLARLLQAFDRIDDETLYLVVIGNKEGFVTGDKSINHIELRKRNKVVFTGFVPDEDLPKFYKMAEALVFPSIYEGFGLPPLEAQACGCPVIASNVASLPEVCGDSVLYCNPYDINDIADKIELLINNKLLKEELKQKGLKNVQRFDWEKSAYEILNVFEKICMS